MSSHVDHPTQGVLELHPKGFGFLRDPKRNYTAQPGDAYVAQPMIQKLGLREGLLLAGPIGPLPLRGGSMGPASSSPSRRPSFWIIGWAT